MAKEILSAQHARDEKEKLEKIISKLKLPLLIVNCPKLYGQHKKAPLWC